MFLWSPFWSILVCKIPQFLAKSYRFGELIILFWKSDTLRLLKIHIIFCPPTGTKIPIFLDSSSWTTYNNNKFKISAATWNDEFELPDGSYSISDIQDYFEYIFLKNGKNIDISLIRIYRIM